MPDATQYLTRGGEAKVYLDTDNKNVIKLNDAIYYATWLEYFNSLVIHNLIFPGTAYTFLGFTMINGNLEAVVKQAFVLSDAIVELDAIKQLLAFNGFENTKQNDYFNRKLGIILEDMHDENVISKNELLFFIDTVFYTIGEDFS